MLTACVRTAAMVLMVGVTVARLVAVTLLMAVLVACGDPYVSIWVVNNSSDDALVVMDVGYPSAFVARAQTPGVSSGCCTFDGSITVYRASDCTVLGRDKGSSLMVVTISEAGVVTFAHGASRNTLNDPALPRHDANCSG